MVLVVHGLLIMYHSRICVHYLDMDRDQIYPWLVGRQGTRLVAREVTKTTCNWLGIGPGALTSWRRGVTNINHNVPSQRQTIVPSMSYLSVSLSTRTNTRWWPKKQRVSYWYNISLKELNIFWCDFFSSKPNYMTLFCTGSSYNQTTYPNVLGFLYIKILKILVSRSKLYGKFRELF